MDQQKLQALIRKGAAKVGQMAGAPYVVYRPKGVSRPTRAQNRLIVLNAVFAAEGAAPKQAPDYGVALWTGNFDSSYTQPGDYLVGCEATFFVARQWPDLPVQCVQTNRVVTLVRPLAAAQGSYSGFFASPGETVILGWPASLLESGGVTTALRPGETRLGSWELLLPALPATPQVADVVTDDLGATYVVGAAEQSTLGWRLLVRQLAA
jgi:hypothetical protein